LIQVVAMLLLVAALSLFGFLLVGAAEMATPKPSNLMLATFRTVTLVGFAIMLVTVLASISEPHRRRMAGWAIALFGIALVCLALALVVQQG